MNPEFRHFSNFPGWDKAPEFLRGLIEKHQAKVILEVGSGANPTIAAQEVERVGLDYTTNDLSAEELAKAPSVFKRWEADLCAPRIWEREAQRYDFIFSRMVNEHVQDGETYFQNLHALLRPGGVTAHCFSTLYALPFMANRMLPERATGWLLNLFNPRDRHQHEKFQAYYSWSRGPSSRSIRRFESAGFEVLEYVGYFGHPYYRQRLPLLDSLEQAKARWLVRHPIPSLTGYAHIVLRRKG
jgi:2-polyprenyl-3-methyl-5-hydroxy-6-metoxy-1,4-benzoquinol methylase